VLTLPDETDIVAEIGGRRLQRAAASRRIAVAIGGGGVTMDRHPDGSASPTDAIVFDCRTARACPPSLQAFWASGDTASVPGSGATEPSGGGHQPGPSHRCGAQSSSLLGLSS
jgi:hypothetical protein